MSRLYLFLWAAKLSPQIECRAISDLRVRLLECCKGAPAEDQETQKGPAGAAGQMFSRISCVVRNSFCCSALCAGLL